MSQDDPIDLENFFENNKSNNEKAYCENGNGYHLDKDMVDEEETIDFNTDENFENLMSEIRRNGIESNKESFPPLKLDDEDENGQSLEEKSKKICEFLDKYKKMNQKKRKMGVIQKAIAKQFAIPLSAAKCINESVFHNPNKELSSVHVTNVDYDVKAEELKHHFESCGEIVRTTIPTNASKRPKGYAFIEFKDESAVQKALELSGTTLNGRAICVSHKRTNIPGFSKTAGRTVASNRRSRAASFMPSFGSAFAPQRFRSRYGGRGLRVSRRGRRFGGFVGRRL